MRISRAQTLLGIVSLILSVFFIFSVVTPESVDVQAYAANAVTAFVESDQPITVSSNPDLTRDHEFRLGYLPSTEDIFPILTLSVSCNFHRGPPA